MPDRFNRRCSEGGSMWWNITTLFCHNIYKILSVLLGCFGVLRQFYCFQNSKKNSLMEIFGFFRQFRWNFDQFWCFWVWIEIKLNFEPRLKFLKLWISTGLCQIFYFKKQKKMVIGRFELTTSRVQNHNDVIMLL
jgi:hypothetical protein